jgi:DHA2 family multidrug resistance protein-like MFS transporter
MRHFTPEPSAERAGRREWVGLAVLALPTLLVALDIGALYLALPRLSADLDTSSVQQLWITDIYGFLMAGFLITMGNLGDRIGRRRLLLIGAAIFGVLSTLAAYSVSAEMLIVSRALMGVAAATLMPSTLALISNMFRDDRQRTTAIAAWVSCLMVGAAVGPVVGGLLLAWFWWGSVFLLGVPVMLLLLAIGPILLPEYRPLRARRLDLVSAGLSLAAILSVIYGLKELAADHVATVAIPIASIVAGVVFGVVFVRRQLRVADPLLDLRLFRNRVFTATLASMLLAAGAMAGTFLLLSQYVQSVLGLTPAMTGVWLLPIGLSIALGSQIAAPLSRRISRTAAIGGGLTIGAVGFVLITQVHPGGGFDRLSLAVLGGALVHVGAGPLFALGAFMVVGSVPPERAGSAASMSETSNAFGSTLGMALLGTLGVAVYRVQMGHVSIPGASSQAVATARNTIAGATVTAHDLPAGIGANLLRTAGDAFTSGMHIAATAGAILFVGLAVLVTMASAAHGRTAGSHPGHRREPDEPGPGSGQPQRPVSARKGRNQATAQPAPPDIETRGHIT